MTDDGHSSYLARRLSQKARLTLLVVLSAVILVVLGWDMATTAPADVQTRAVVLAVVGFVVSVAGFTWLIRRSQGKSVSAEALVRFEGWHETVRGARAHLILVAVVMYPPAVAWRANVQDLAAMILGLLLGLEIQGVVRTAMSNLFRVWAGNRFWAMTAMAPTTSRSTTS